MNKGYRIEPFPRQRVIVVDGGRLGARRPMMYGLLELDVTRPRRMLQEHKEKTGESLSFTGYLVACLAKAVEAHPAVQAYRDWRGRLVYFDDVDVVTLIETKVDGVALPHVIRQANRKTFREIHDEIRSIQSQPARSEQRNALNRLGPYAPRFVRGIFYWALRKNPFWLKEQSGTVVVTAVGMFGGSGSGWGITFVPWHTLGLMVGSIVEKPGLVDGRVEPRQYLCLTISLDHDVVDGAPAARFVRSLGEWIESGNVAETAVDSRE